MHAAQKPRIQTDALVYFCLFITGLFSLQTSFPEKMNYRFFGSGGNGSDRAAPVVGIDLAVTGLAASAG